MDHEEAIQSHAAERYVARELPVADRDAFEEHFFDCPECAEEVRWEQLFIANGRAAARELKTQRANGAVPGAALHGWRDTVRGAFSWRPAFTFSLAANAALACALVCALLIPLRQPPGPQLMTAYFAPGIARGGEASELHRLPPKASTYLISFENTRNSSYTYEILNSGGKRETSGSIPPFSGDEDKAYLAIPLVNLAPGVHTLLVKSLPSGEVVSRSLFQTSN